LQTYERLAPLYDNLMTSSRFYRNLRLEELSLFRRYVQPAIPGQAALDVGCGTGYFSALLDSLGYETYAVDKSIQMLRVAKKKLGRSHREGIHFVNSDIMSLGLNENFDVITAFGVLMNHISNWDALLQLFTRLLKKNGLLLFDIDNYMGLDSFSQMFIRARSISDLNKWAKDVYDSIKTLRSNMGYTSNWSFYLGSERVGLYLTYYPLSFLKKTLKTIGFKVMEKRGANIFTCLLPWWIKSAASVENRQMQGWKDVITRALRGIDRCVPSNTKLIDLAANVLFAVHKATS